jgi:hypothetical protein
MKGRALLRCTCTDYRIGQLMQLLPSLGGPESIAELRRWLNWEAADPLFRANAAATLGKAHDHASTPQIVALLDSVDRTPEGEQRFMLLLDALRDMPAPEASRAIQRALLREGNTAFSRPGLVVLGSFGIDDSVDILKDFIRNEGPEWRKAVLGA